MTESGINNLKCAIVKQAVCDYESAVRKLNRLTNPKEFEKEVNRRLEQSRLRREKLKSKKVYSTTMTAEQFANNINLEIKKARDTVEKIEAFFRSAWYMWLCDIDGEKMIKRLREQNPLDEIVTCTPT